MTYGSLILITSLILVFYFSLSLYIASSKSIWWGVLLLIIQTVTGVTAYYYSGHMSAAKALTQQDSNTLD